MARISIFGIGYVGTVAAACLAKDGHTVIAVDIDESKVDSIKRGQTPIVEDGLAELVADGVASGKLSATSDVADAIENTDASFVCVGTPSAPDGSVGLDYVVGVCTAIGGALARKDSFHSVVIRSTIVPGSMEGICIPALEAASGLVAGKEFGVGYFPEFLRESTAIRDYYDPGLIVFGALDHPTNAILDEINGGLNCEINHVDIRTAEMIKYTSNCWRAVKITFANEIGNISKAVGLDGQEVMRVLCSDLKVNMSPTFMRPGFAFGGSCLPKDLRALRFLARSNNVPSPMLDCALSANEEQIRRAEHLVDNLVGRSIGMVGVSFKAGTDDLRESPLATLADRLIKKGYNLKIYDPYVKEAFDEKLSGAGRGNDYIDNLEGRLVSGIGSLIDQSEILLIGNTYDEAIEPLSQAAQKNLPMVDLARLKPGMTSRDNYEGICW
ncbi:UDP-glucose/GDP-mannose dehydrogenase family protein [Cohaesibacter sp. CAU 1516]|uniref:nucleotide sugar dehydrogenase n=1 Tax=Cohaesibacter sp. CAU 1516 TaxID=2576038 RepID=UPI0010FF1E70|nr:nucleotide sugar dehydrogenase [Cohaesibacter sp. CAU 1516]TLP47173.1 UDP-glucose/GDP-mannose dehydrogenase family protein [Cohaesibacter sp. CAU 1516]